MNQNVISQSGEDNFHGLVKNDEIRWFVDANVLIRGLVTEWFDDPSRVYVLDKVRDEVRKRPEAKRGNDFINTVEEIGNIVAQDWYSPDIAESVDFLNQCAKELSPGIRVNTQRLMDQEGHDSVTAESLAIERLALEGTFFESDLINRAVRAGVMSENNAKINKRTRRSWFEYPRKRRLRIAIGEYQFTDESVVATAIAHSILKNEKVCILSVDRDLAAIMKQVADNWLWSSSAVDCELARGVAILEEVVPLWEDRCQGLNHYRQLCQVRTAMRAEDVEDPTQLYEPLENEVILVRPDDWEIGNYGFNQQMVAYARDIESISARCRLIRKGWWVPRFT